MARRPSVPAAGFRDLQGLRPPVEKHPRDGLVRSRPRCPLAAQEGGKVRMRTRRDCADEWLLSEDPTGIEVIGSTKRRTVRGPRDLAARLLSAPATVAENEGSTPNEMIVDWDPSPRVLTDVSANGGNNETV